jgi:hypothetical protein
MTKLLHDPGGQRWSRESRAGATRRNVCDLVQAQNKQIIEVVRESLWLLPRRGLFSLDHLAPSHAFVHCLHLVCHNLFSVYRSGSSGSFVNLQGNQNCSTPLNSARHCLWTLSPTIATCAHLLPTRLDEVVDSFQGTIRLLHYLRFPTRRVLHSFLPWILLTSSQHVHDTEPSAQLAP